MTSLLQAVMLLLIVSAVALGLLSMSMFAAPTAGVHLLGVALLLAVLARIAQASVQGRK